MFGGRLCCRLWAAARRFSSDRVVAVSMSAGAVLLLLCATGWLGGTGTMVALAVTGFAVGIGGPSRDMMIKKATPKGATGRVYGTVYSGLDVGFARVAADLWRVHGPGLVRPARWWVLPIVARLWPSMPPSVSGRRNAADVSS